MAWQTGRRICSAPSSCWSRRGLVFSRRASLSTGNRTLAVAAGVLRIGTAIGLLTNAALARAQSAAPAYVRDCRPCTFSPGDKLAPFSFTFDVARTGTLRAVRAIDVSRDSQPVQRLAVPEMEASEDNAEFFFGGVDVNFDGLLDLMLMTRRGVANTYAAYWLFDPKSGTYTSLGTYPEFRVDTQKHRLLTYERGGWGGLIHEAREYEFLQGKLSLMREEKQDATSRPGVFRKVIRERSGGVLRTVKTETVRAPK